MTTQQDGIAMHESTVRYNPNDRASHAELGVLLVSTGKPSQGRDELETARRLGLEDAQLWFYIGLADRELGDVPDAAGALEQARKLDRANQAVLPNPPHPHWRLRRAGPAQRIAKSGNNRDPNETL